MHNLPSGNWIRDLKPAQRPTGDDHWSDSTEVVGSKDMVAAVLWERVVLFWETKGEEVTQLNPLNLGNLRCRRGGGDIQVCGTKVAILARGNDIIRGEGVVEGSGMASLIVMEKGERGLVKKTLSNFTGCLHGGLVALNGNFIALAKDVLKSDVVDTRIALWCGDKRLSDVLLPGRMGHSVTGIILEAPYVILSLFADRESTRERNVTIKVYSVSSSKQMEKISSQGCLLKSIPITGITGPIPEIRGDPTGGRFVFNDFIIGHVQQQWGDKDTAVFIMDKKLLLNPRVSAKDVWMRRINLPYDCTMVNINNTSLVCAKDATTMVRCPGEMFGSSWTWGDPKKGKLFMISFWAKPVRCVRFS